MQGTVAKKGQRQRDRNNKDECGCNWIKTRIPRLKWETAMNNGKEARKVGKRSTRKKKHHDEDL